MTALDHPLVRDYLDRLHQETVRLGVPEGRELEAQIREHLIEALGDAPSEAEVRHSLDRLGDPVELVDAAGGGPAPGTGPGLPPEPGPRAWREVGALVLLVSSVLTFWLAPVNLLTWVAGLVLLVMAERWSVTERLWGAAVLGLTPWLALAVLFLDGGGTQTCWTDGSGQVECTGGEPLVSPGVAIVLGVAWVALYVWTVVHLARAAARRDVVDYSDRDVHA